MIDRVTELYRKRWSGEATSAEQDELDTLLDVMRALAAQAPEPMLVRVDRVTRPDRAITHRLN